MIALLHDCITVPLHGCFRSLPGANDAKDRALRGLGSPWCHELDAPGWQDMSKPVQPKRGGMNPAPLPAAVQNEAGF